MEPMLPRPDPSDAQAVWSLPSGSRARPSPHYLAVTALLLVPMTLTASLGSMSFSSPDGTAIVSFWPAAAFQVVFSIWFGAYGALAGVIGPMLGNSLVGGSPFLFIPANSIQCCLAGLWFRYRKLDPRLTSRRDWLGLILVGCVLGNALGALTGVAESHLRALAASGVAPGPGFWAEKLFTWFSGNTIPSLFLAPALLKAASPIIVRDPLFCQTFWGGADLPRRRRLWPPFSDLPMAAKLTMMVLVAGVLPLLVLAAWSVWSTVQAADNLAAAMNQLTAQRIRNESERHELLLRLWAAVLDAPGLNQASREELVEGWRSVPEAFRNLKIEDRARVEAEMPPPMLRAFREDPIAFYSVGTAPDAGQPELRGVARLTSVPDKVLTGLAVWRQDVLPAGKWPDIEAILVLDEVGNELYRSAPSALVGWRPEVPRPNSSSYTIRHGERDWHVAEAMIPRTGLRFITLASVQTGLAFNLANIPNPLAVLINLAIFGSVIAGSAIAGRISGRVLTMAEAVRDSGSEPGKLRLPVAGGDELGYLAETLNRMSDELAESIRQLRQITAEKERLAAEMALAQRMQRSVLPAGALEVPGYELSAATHPAREVGGDFFDYFIRDDGSVVAMVGDAAGKGLRAAMFITEIHALAHAAALHLPTPGAVLGSVNSAMVSGRQPTEDFATVLCAVLEPARHRLLYASAGHQPPILCHAGETRRLELGGLPLAMAPEADYELSRVELTPGDWVLVYSDGATDAVNSAGEMFGAERLEAAAGRATGPSADKLLQAILESVRSFAKGAPQADDITLLVLRRCA